MPFFRVYRFGKTGWDETRAMIVSASNAERARQVAVDHFVEHDHSEKPVFANPDLVGVKLVQDDTDFVVMVDFKSG